MLNSNPILYFYSSIFQNIFCTLCWCCCSSSSIPSTLFCIETFRLYSHSISNIHTKLKWVSYRMTLIDASKGVKCKRWKEPASLDYLCLFNYNSAARRGNVIIARQEGPSWTKLSLLWLLWGRTFPQNKLLWRQETCPRLWTSARRVLSLGLRTRAHFLWIISVGKIPTLTPSNALFPTLR